MLTHLIKTFYYKGLQRRLSNKIDSDYIDLGFFEPEPGFDSWKAKYLMVDNRDGIAQMENDDTIILRLTSMGCSSCDSLAVTEYGDPEVNEILGKDSTSDYFYLTKVFEPGEGKLFRIEEYI
ncbi:hypothetical protein GF359_03070 [candidate division WOR-3 bacterium]|uniref:Uncharacterized protein n=1 Tax=candidate division WOR-3 bacterium TaxID=2052148 RepID=A0A9D5KAC0_UNCW3|nr:hypothetical protein [candidate division WOR-3 bacterium]MBD3364176.1 hypothetical protein [candidate division WOR-3 bacterium]